LKPAIRRLDGMAVIGTTLELVRTKLNEFFRNADPKEEDWVILSNVVDHVGSLYEEAKDKIVMFLANIQHETTISTYNPTVPAKGGDRYVVVTPPLYIDLFVLFYANFYDKNYREGLGMISRTISFFQQNPWFNHDNLPGLDPIIDKLTFEMTNLDVTDLNYLMGLIGTKYLPSAYYKVRMIPFRSDTMQAQTPAMKGVRTPGEPADRLPVDSQAARDERSVGSFKTDDEAGEE